jgi:hypothetical protein
MRGLQKRRISSFSESIQYTGKRYACKEAPVPGDFRPAQLKGALFTAEMLRRGETVGIEETQEPGPMLERRRRRQAARMISP